MIAKCIGGRRDGATVDVDREHPSPDYRLPIISPISTLKGLDLPVVEATFDYEVYVLDSISFYGNKALFYLRFIKWSPIEAISFLLRNHNRAGE